MFKRLIDILNGSESKSIKGLQLISHKLYSGIIGSASSVGSVCGFLSGGYSLSFYVNVGDGTNDLSSEDPAWVGNWWAPYIFCAAMAVCCALMLLQFRKLIRGVYTGHVDILPSIVAI